MIDSVLTENKDDVIIMIMIRSLSFFHRGDIESSLLHLRQILGGGGGGLDEENPTARELHKRIKAYSRLTAKVQKALMSSSSSSTSVDWSKFMTEINDMMTSEASNPAVSLKLHFMLADIQKRLPPIPSSSSTSPSSTKKKSKIKLEPRKSSVVLEMVVQQWPDSYKAHRKLGLAYLEEVSFMSYLDLMRW